MATRYETFLRTVPPLSGCTHRELQILARLVDDILIPPGRQVGAARGEVVFVASGETVVLPDGSVFAGTSLRLIVIGRREMLSLLREAPVLGRRLLAACDSPHATGAARLRATYDQL